MFEAVEFVEVRGSEVPKETVLGEYENEVTAVDAARAAKSAYVNSHEQAFAWWVVRQPGARLAQFISDSRSDKEFVLDLATGQLVEV
jgi:hypothetical protein